MHETCPITEAHPRCELGFVILGDLWSKFEIWHVSIGEYGYTLHTENGAFAWLTPNQMSGVGIAGAGHASISFEDPKFFEKAYKFMAMYCDKHES